MFIKSRFKKSAIKNQNPLACINLTLPDLINHHKRRLEFKYSFPANLAAAKRHTRALRYGYYTDDNQMRICPCCGFQVTTHSLSFIKDDTTILCLDSVDEEKNTKRKQLFQEYQQVLDYLPIQRRLRVTSCVAFFFTFIKFLIYLLIIRTLILDSYNILTNLLQGDFCEEMCSKQFWSISSIIHKYNRTDLISVTNKLALAVTGVFIISFLCFRWFQYRMYDTIDKENQTQDDFTIFVENIEIVDLEGLRANSQSPHKPQFNYKKGIEEFFTEKIREWIAKQIPKKKKQAGSLQRQYRHFIKNSNYSFKYKQPPSDIVKSISLCYNLSGLQKIAFLRNSQMKILERLAKQHQKLNAGEKEAKKLEYQEEKLRILNKIKLLNESEIQMNRSFAKVSNNAFKLTHFVGSAFVSFKFQHYRDHIVEAFNENKEDFKFKDRVLKITRAGYPTDIKWRNLKIIEPQRRRRVIASYGILFSVILVAFLIILGSSEFKKFLIRNLLQDKQNQSQGGIHWGSLSITLVTTLITLGINKFLEFMSKKLTDWEKHQSRANEKFSLIVKLLITQFLNTAMIYLALSLLSNEDNSGLMSNEGLIFQISSLIILSGVIQIILNAFDYKALWRWIKLQWNYHGKEDLQEINKFQVNVNIECEYPEFDIAKRYSYYLLQLYVVAFYSYVIPVIAPAVAIIFFFQYSIDKYNLFKKSSLFYEIEYSLSRYILNIAEGSILMFALGAFIFSMKITSRPDIILLINLLVAGVFFFGSLIFPHRWSKRTFRKNQVCQTEQYDDCLQKGKFKNTYWFSNPATKLVEEKNQLKEVEDVALADECRWTKQEKQEFDRVMWRCPL